MTSRTSLGIVLLGALSPTCAPPAATAVDRARDLMAVWESGDTKPLDTLLADSAVYDDYPNHTAYHGPAEIAAYVTHVHGWARDIRFRITGLQGTDSTAAVEWVMNAVQDRPIGHRVPVATNRPVELHGVTLVKTRNGRIVRAADYIDVLSFVLQLGGRVELPGGTVLGGTE